MAETPPFGIRFKPRATPGVVGSPPAAPPGKAAPAAAANDEVAGDAIVEPVPRPERIAVYQDALAFATRAARVIDLAESERFFLRDQLDRKSSIVPQLVAQGLATADMPTRRALYHRAREMVTDCMAILDLVAARGAVKTADMAPARALAGTLLDKLLALTVPPSRVW